MTTDPANLLRLLEPFPSEHVGKLPRVTCSDCSGRRRCDQHKKERCKVCKAWVSTKHIHLDYVGHADVTRRLLETDPAWQWEPAAVDDNGLPLLDTDHDGNPVGMWIRLTVLGVTRLGYGSCPSSQNDAVKVLIGDALRNAAMRFGVALDLWAQGDRSDPAAENAVAAGGAADRRRRAEQAAPVEQHTDHAWLTDMESRISVARDRGELNALAREIGARKQAGQCEPVHEAHLWALGTKRQAAIDSGPPKNKDGSISRSRATDEQLAAVGAMTKDQKKEHNALERDTLKNPKLAERATGPADDDPWATGGEPA
jgi:hypothetical protein